MRQRGICNPFLQVISPAHRLSCMFGEEPHPSSSYIIVPRIEVHLALLSYEASERLRSTPHGMRIVFVRLKFADS
jgi:hypothetical protein